MKKSWGLTEKTLSGEKKIESRWYMARYAPWDRIKAGETVYFKNSGEPVAIKAQVTKILQFSDLSPKKVKEILEKYGKDIGIGENQLDFLQKKYCLLIFLKNPVKIKPFEIDKKGFGMMSAWITVKNIKQIKNTPTRKLPSEESRVESR
ncbi:MAG: hypothetical protein Q8R34_00570 [bacterium]|nr:hypothetical protein [bacterium]